MNKELKRDEINVSLVYGDECILPKNDFFKKFNFNENGLTSEESTNSINKYGLNELKQAKEKKWYNFF